MINIFNNIFKKKSSKNHVSSQEPLKYNSITFSIDQLDRIKIDIFFENEKHSYAETFGKVLYGINHGLYEDKILECLVSLSKTNPLLVAPIQQALTAWGIMLIDKADSEQKQNDQPIPFIKPTSVFHSK